MQRGGLPSRRAGSHGRFVAPGVCSGHLRALGFGATPGLALTREAHSHQGRAILRNWGLPTDFPDTQGQHVSPGDMPPSTARTQGPCTRIHSRKGLTGQIQQGNPSLREQLSCAPQGGWRRGPGEGLTWATGQVPETGPEPGVGTVTGGKLLGSQQTSITWGPPGVRGQSQPLAEPDVAPGAWLCCTQGPRVT